MDAGMRSSFIWCIQFSLCRRILLCRISLCDSILTLVCYFLLDPLPHEQQTEKKEVAHSNFYSVKFVCFRYTLAHNYFICIFLNETIILPFVSCVFFPFVLHAHPKWVKLSRATRSQPLYSIHRQTQTKPNIYAIGQCARRFAGSPVAILCHRSNSDSDAGTSS